MSSGCVDHLFKYTFLFFFCFVITNSKVKRAKMNWVTFHTHVYTQKIFFWRKKELNHVENGAKILWIDPIFRKWRNLFTVQWWGWMRSVDKIRWINDCASTKNLFLFSRDKFHWKFWPFAIIKSSQQTEHWYLCFRFIHARAFSLVLSLMLCYWALKRLSINNRMTLTSC